MRKLKKFKKFSQGGLGSSMGAGTPDFAVSSIETDEGYKREKEQGAKNLESIKNFFMGRRSKDEASAPIEERKPPKPAEEAPAPAPAAIKPEPAKTEKIEAPKVSRNSADDTAATSFDYPPQREQNPALDEAKEQGRRAAAAFKPAAKPAASKPAAISRDSEAGKSRGMKGDGPPVFSTPSKPAAPKAAKAPGPEDIPGTEASKGPKGELIDNSNLPAKQFAQSVLGASPALRGVGAGVRGAMGLGRMLESAPKAEGKGTGKFPEDKPEISVLKTPAVVRAKPKSAEPKPKTEAESMGLRETGPMRAKREAKEKFEAAGKEAKEASDKASKNAADEVAAEAAKRAATKRQTPDNRRFPNKGSASSGRPTTRAETKPSGNKFNRPVGEKRGPKTDEILEREGLSAKKGGKIPAFKKGGLVGRADGCAIRGKTKGRMV